MVNYRRCFEGNAVLKVPKQSKCKLVQHRAQKRNLELEIIPGISLFRDKVPKTIK